MLARLVKKQVKSGFMPNADMYVMLVSNSPKCAAGNAYTGTSYGYGVCGTNPGRRSMMAWYYSYGDEKENDLETALVRSQAVTIFSLEINSLDTTFHLILSFHLLPIQMALCCTKIES